MFSIILAYMIITDSPLFLNTVDYGWGWYVFFVVCLFLFAPTSASALAKGLDRG